MTENLRHLYSLASTNLRCALKIKPAAPDDSARGRRLAAQRSVAQRPAAIATEATAARGLATLPAQGKPSGKTQSVSAKRAAIASSRGESVSFGETLILLLLALVVGVRLYIDDRPAAAIAFLLLAGAAARLSRRRGGGGGGGGACNANGGASNSSTAGSSGGGGTANFAATYVSSSSANAASTVLIRGGYLNLRRCDDAAGVLVGALLVPLVCAARVLHFGRHAESSERASPAAVDLWLSMALSLWFVFAAYARLARRRVVGALMLAPLAQGMAGGDVGGGTSVGASLGALAAAALFPTLWWEFVSHWERCFTLGEAAVAASALSLAVYRTLAHLGGAPAAAADERTGSAATPMVLVMLSSLAVGCALLVRVARGVSQAAAAAAASSSSSSSSMDASTGSRCLPSPSPSPPVPVARIRSSTPTTSQRPRSRRARTVPSWLAAAAAPEANGVWLSLSDFSLAGPLLLAFAAWMCASYAAAAFVLRREPFLWLWRFMASPSGSTGVSRFFIVLTWLCVLLVALLLAPRGQLRTRNIVARKFYHLLALLMFLPVMYANAELLRLGGAGALCALFSVELWCVAGSPPAAARLRAFMQHLADKRDRGALTLSHLYLLVGCVAPLWLEAGGAGGFTASSAAGLVSLGVYDAVASAVGSAVGRRRIPPGRKTVEGTLSGALAALAVHALTVAIAAVGGGGGGAAAAGKPLSLRAIGAHLPYEAAIAARSLLVPVAVMALFEVYTTQIDNLTLPPLFYAVLLLTS